MGLPFHRLTFLSCVFAICGRVSSNFSLVTYLTRFQFLQLHYFAIFFFLSWQHLLMFLYQNMSLHPCWMIPRRLTFPETDHTDFPSHIWILRLNIPACLLESLDYLIQLPYFFSPNLILPCGDLWISSPNWRTINRSHQAQDCAKDLEILVDSSEIQK